MQFLVEDLSCKHCEAVIRSAILNVDPAALVQIDIPSKTVTIQTAQSSSVMSELLCDAGYAPALLQP